MPPVPEPLDALMQRLAALEDREAIRNLIASYGPAADRGDAEAVARLWTEDGRYDVGGMGIATGHKAIADLITGPTHQALLAAGCAHLLGPVEIALDGECATAIGHSLVLRNAGTAFEILRASANRWQLEKRQGRWEVVLRVNRVLDGGDAARAILAPLPAGGK